MTFSINSIVFKKVIAVFIVAAVVCSCGEKGSEKAGTDIEEGEASWFSVETNGGTTTASGEPLQDDALTAAHPSHAFGTRLRVTNLENDRSEIVRVTDRGPFTKNRIIDVTIGTAKKLGFAEKGVTRVRIERMPE